MNGLSACAEIFRIFLYHIYLSSGKVSLESEMGYVPTFENLVHLTWNDPINKYICPVFRRWCVLPPEVIFVKAFWSKKTPSIVHKGVSFPTFQNHSPISNPPPPSPALSANWSFQVFLINRNATVKQCRTTTEHWVFHFRVHSKVHAR